MNYQALKSMIDNLVQNYKCPDCGTTIGEKDIDIVGAAGNNVNVDIFCPNCKRHAMVKSQVLQIDITNFLGLKDSLSKLKNKITQTSTIKDEEMVKLSKELKNRHLNAKDLFSDEKSGN